MKTKTPKTFKAPKTPKVKAVKPAANAAAPKVKKPRTTKIKYRILRLSVLSVTLCIVSLMIVMSIFLTSAYVTSYENQTKALAQSYGEVISNTINSLSLELQSAGGNQEVLNQMIPLVARRTLKHSPRLRFSRITQLHITMVLHTTVLIFLTASISRKRIMRIRSRYHRLLYARPTVW